jgi:hypothetical protein
VALEPDGRIVVAYNFGVSNFELARILAAGPRISSFTASPSPVAAGSSVMLSAADVQALNPGSTIAQVAFYLDSNADGKLDPATDSLLGYGTRTVTGTWTFTFSTAGLTAGDYSYFTVAQDSFGAFGDPIAITVTVV